MMNKRFQKLLFDGEWDSQEYCDFSTSAANTIAGKDILLAIWNKTGTQILAVAGQQDLTLNREAETAETTTKDTEGGWSSAHATTKSWSIDLTSAYLTSDESHHILSEAFENGDNVCVKIYNKKTASSLFGGLATITSYSFNAPVDDICTSDISLQGVGKIHDFAIENIKHDTIPG